MRNLVAGKHDVQLIVDIRDLKRAFRRLVIRLNDEATISSEAVIFRARNTVVEIGTNNSSERISAEVMHSGTVYVPAAIFCAFAKTIRFHRRQLSSASPMGAFS